MSRGGSRTRGPIQPGVKGHLSTAPWAWAVRPAMVLSSPSRSCRRARRGRVRALGAGMRA